MDNASIHKNKRTKELIEEAGCKLVFLPPYSPDLNPIEKVWAIIKAAYKTFKQRGYDHHKALDNRGKNEKTKTVDRRALSALAMTTEGAAR